MSKSDTIIAQEKKNGNSYGSILKSSSVVGGAEVVNYGVGLFRTKVIALLLGPSGVGLLGLFSNIQQMLTTFAGLGVSFSAVREVAKEGDLQDPEALAHAIVGLRRVCWVLGLLGWFVAALVAYPVSQLVLQDTSYALGVALLGCGAGLSIISSGQKSLIQGLRRIGDLARIKIASVVVSTVVAVALYLCLREDGIVPALLATALCQLSVSWYFARRISLVSIEQSWPYTWRYARRLLGMGMAFMWSILLVALVDLFIRSFILRELGIDAVGIYQAAWAVSGLFASFVLNAMGADFYPRLTQVEANHPEVVRLVNEQTEIGLLLALPGVLATLIFAPLIITVLYSSAFNEAAHILPWLALGVMGRVITWPLGFILLAKGAKGRFALVETIMQVPRIFLFIWLVGKWGLLGAAIAWPLHYMIYAAIIYPMSRQMVGFSYQPQSLRLLGIVVLWTLAAFGVAISLPQEWGICIGALIVTGGSWYSLRALLKRLDSKHRIMRILHKFPFLGDIV